MHSHKLTPILLALCLSTAPVFGQGYTYKRILRGGADSPFTAGESMAISPHGEIVLFAAKERNGVTGLFTVTGGVVKRIQDDAGDLNNIFNAAVNSRGRVIVSGVTDDGAAVIRVVDGETVHTPFRSTDPADAAGALVLVPRLNDNGVGVFTVRPHHVGAAFRGAKVVLTDGPNSIVIADQASNLAGASTVLNADINNRLNVAFIATGLGGGGGLYRYQDNVFSFVMPNGAFGQTFLATLASPSLNDHGWIAFEAWNDAFQFGILLARPGETAAQTIAFNRGAAQSPFDKVSRPVLNNAGVVAFVGRAETASPNSIQTWTSGVLRKVIGPGDAMFGSTVTFIDAGRTFGKYMDEGGAIVFSYALQNGEIGIALATPPPAVTPGTLANGATFVAGGLVPGSWAQVKGTGLAESTRIWADADFAGLDGRLPTKLDGVEVKVNGQNAAVYFISPSQVTFQVPDLPVGSASVQVTRNGVTSAAVTAQIVDRAPGIFPYAAAGKYYAAGVFLDGKITGDPALTPVFRRARAGDTVQLFVTGLERSAAGTIPASRAIEGVSVRIGEVTVPASGAALVGVGLFQVNFTVPSQFASLAAAEYPIRVQVAGVSSPASINGSPNPDGPVLIPIEPVP